MKKSNSKNKKQAHITRRDFLNGCAIGVAAGSGLTPLELMAQGGQGAVALPPDY